jgi:periplasmic divalent cation tolerance protein
MQLGSPIDTFTSSHTDYAFMSFLLVYVTTKNDKEAKTIANHLLSKHLIACANMFPIRSLYWWKGEIESDDEVAMIMKTQEMHKQSIISEVKALHSYDVPCIEFFKIEDGNPDYLEWIITETTSS